MAGTVKHDMNAIFATLRADGWGPATEGATSLRKLAAQLGVPAGTLLPKVRQERAKAGGGLLAPPAPEPAAKVKRKRAAAVDPDAD